MTVSSQNQVNGSESRRPVQKLRFVKSLPAQVLNHCTVCLEEQLFDQAIALLSSGLTSGTCTSRPAYVPARSHLAVVATLAVHPQLTTRTSDPAKPIAATDALRYLRHVSRLVSPRAAGLDQAFQFNTDRGDVHRNKRAKTRRSENCGEILPLHEDDYIRSDYAGQDSIWKSAADFWSVVGWSFNCSVKHKHRWQRWKEWLEMMLDVLEKDFDEHASEGTAANSMIAVFLRPIGEGRNNKRRLMRALLANGSTKALAEFHEIWRNETKLPKVVDAKQNVAKKRKLDLDNDEFGDYFDESDQENPESLSRRSRSATAFSSRKISRQPSADENNDSDDESAASAANATDYRGLEAFGGMDSIALRQRLLRLLLELCSRAPSLLLDIEDFLDLCTEFIRPLKLAIFQQLVTPSKAFMDADPKSSLNQMLLRPLLSSQAPVYDANAMTQTDFETCYAPFTANTTSVADNAKVSLLVEDLMKLLWKTSSLAVTPTLRRVVTEGIGARNAKAEMDRRRKTGLKALEDEDAMMVLVASGVRMSSLLACLS
ncbi:hypothetical protein LTR62_001504 [Meristemomyces frigidus]|uniref:Uncharacterized protein n=1 Tax=Meristemomyces frigidus TaxID=1508187 RepID=A0AAN7TLU3_9PEZI|nr:hypothetical protein LTR62_001504 [Meristemomyces frigidus]